MKFLIVDDNPADRELIIRELKREFPDSEFEEVAHQRDFDEALSRADFNVVITDYRLQWTDGLWILKTAKEKFPRIPVVMATDSGSEEIAVEAMKSGLDDYVLKRNLRRLPFAVKESLEKIRLLEELRESEARYRTLVEQIPTITYIAALDEASTTLYISPQVEIILGYSPEEYKADPDIWRKRLHSDDYKRVMAEVARSHTSNEPFITEYRMIARDGRIVWFRDQATIVRDEAGRPLYLQGVMLDVTEHKQAEEEKAQLARQMKFLLDSTGEGILGVDINYNGTFFNRAASIMTGYAPEEAIGKNMHELLHHSYSDGRPYPIEKCPVFRGLQTGQGVRVDTEVIWRKDGTSFPVEYSSYPIVEDGVLKGAVITFTNITDRKKTEEEREQLTKRFRFLLESTDEGIYGLDTEYRCIFFNKSASEMTGYNPEEVLGRSTHELLHHSYSDGTPYPVEKCPIFRAIRTGQGTRISTEVFWRKDGTSFPVEYSSYPIVEEGVIKGAVITFTDITERKRAEELQLAYETERRIAKILQESLIQPVPSIQGLDIGVAYESALEAARVGGDFYDIFEVGEGKVIIVIGDVSGKSVEAAVMTATTRATIRALAYTNFSPDYILERANESVMRQVRPGSFITIAIVFLDIKNGTFLYASAGHPALIACRTECNFLEVKQGLPIGAFSERYESQVGILGKDEMLIFYTDGLVEARKDVELFGYDRVLEVISVIAGLSSQDVADRLHKAAKDFAGGRLKDDIAIIAVKRIF